MMFPRFRLPVRSLLLSAILLTEVGAVAAAVQLASPFGNNMVLQRGKPVPVWGTAAPAEAVSVDFAGQTIATTADANGRWRVELPALAADPAACRRRLPGLEQACDALSKHVARSTPPQAMEVRRGRCWSWMMTSSAA